MSCVTCHMSRVTCHLSHVAYHMSQFFLLISLYKVLELVGGGFVINGAYPVWLIKGQWLGPQLTTVYKVKPTNIFHQLSLLCKDEKIWKISGKPDMVLNMRLGSRDAQGRVILCKASMEKPVVQYSTIQFSTVQYSTVQYSTVQYSTDWVPNGI